MRTPKKAVVLAAGYGTRMRPLSLCTPKPMMPLWGKPLIEHVCNALAGWGVREVLINLHHLPCSIVRHFQHSKPCGLKTNFSFEPEILGTGGVLSRAGWFLDDSPFWMINADIACDLNPKPLLETFSKGRFIAVLWLNADAGPRTVEMKDSRITGFESRRPGAEGTYTFCGLQLVSPDLLRHVPERGFSTIIQAYTAAMARGRKVAGVSPARAFWADIGTPTAYLRAHGSVLERFRNKQAGGALIDAEREAEMSSLQDRGVRVSGFVSVGKDVTLEKGASIANSVIWNKATVASGASMENMIVGERAEVRAQALGVDVRSSRSGPQDLPTMNALLACALDRLKWNPAETAIAPMEARGSERVFIRLKHEGQSVILMHYSLEREENALYTRHARFLKEMGWPVPSVVVDVPEKQFAIIEDFGDRSLQRVVETSRLPCVFPAYQKVVSAVVKLHRHGSGKAQRAQVPMALPFRADLYRWEREWFSNNFLRKRLCLPADRTEGILAELAGVASRLQRERMVLIHRDLQSSNIFFIKGRPGFVDFQGMRLGPAAYDIASLLCDPYAELAIRTQKRLLDFYNQSVPERERIGEDVFWLAAIERLAQALGAYAWLSVNAETERFGKYVQPGLRMMLIALRQSGQCPRLLSEMRGALDAETAAGPVQPQ